MALPATPWFHRAALAALVCLGSVAIAHAAAPQPGPPIAITRLTAPISIDGDLTDPGWKGVTPVTQWYETRVGDSVEPQVKNVGWLAYDDKYLYAAFEFEDPNPKLVRAPLGDHDQISGTTDYAGIIVDSRNDGKTAQMFLANLNGLEYDAISSDVTGEDNSPDWFWDTKGKLTATGWTMEIRVPFSSLRYAHTPAPTWGILLYRNYPRDQHYQFFSAKLPRDVSCFICNSSKMTGLENLPQGSHLVIAPYATTQKTAALPSDGSAPLGSPLVKGPVEDEYGLDVKWSPLSGLALDGTINPDFSQIEADAAQIVANERFALFYPEKRTFFLEGVDLFSTPFQAVYTRTITNPDAGARATGRANSTAFTALWARDAGGGAVILPGPQGSDFANQDLRSNASIVRARRDFGQSFLSVLGTSREYDEGGHNRVAGPDMQWRPNARNTFTAQALWSDSKTPNRPDLGGSEWTGKHLEDHALIAWYQYSDAHIDFFTQGQELGPDFRADNGFIPQVGFREYYGQTGYTIRPKKRFFTRFRIFAQSFLDQEIETGDALQKNAQIGFGADGRWSSFTRLEFNYDEILVGGKVIPRTRPRFEFDASPSRAFGNLQFIGYFGEEIDFDNARPGTGMNLSASGTWRPDDHTTISATGSTRWVDVDDATLGSGRLFTASLGRVRGTYMFNARTFVRLIGQYLQTDRDPALYTFPVSKRSAGVSLNGLFAYKLNWQTVFYAGYGDDSAYSNTTTEMERARQQAFLKVSYAWQH
jgi:hypothetical protein